MVDRPPFSAEEFFKSQTEPAGLEGILNKVEVFILENIAKGKRVVLVTVS